MFDMLTQLSFAAVGIKAKRLHPKAILPQVMTPGSAAADLYAVEDQWLHPNKPTLFGTGWAFELPSNMLYFEVVPRSGLAYKENMTVANSPATIDFDYRGELKVMLYNRTGQPINIKAGERMAQLIVGITFTSMVPFNEVEELTSTERGEGGFGSTGKS